ncbi:retrovirus-related pol polyprotein from transposon TNT 1-94 [Tanacetum coccineum]|uniref:Retrovirus-related pol polyprotein from transposon TNT 1-94 n=1 Tax=Tanacetum coccineum TaxID=301880 RepID=A0ABQ5HCD7_9ASTR
MGKRKSLALKAKKESSDDECSTFKSEDEEYAMAVRDFKKFFKRRGRFDNLGMTKRRSKEAEMTRTEKGSWSDSGEEDDEKAKDETCLVAQASNEVLGLNHVTASTLYCLGVDLEPDEWIKHSGCSKHMTGNQKLFSTYKAYNRGNVIFGSNIHGNIIGKGQICDNKFRVTFSEHNSEITKDGKVIGRGIRKKGLYVMKLGNKPKDKICLATIDENSTLWHRRLGHANMRLIQSLASKELVRNLPKLKFDQHFCDACKIGKQAHASHKAKNIVSMTRCLELLHMDLFGPSAVRSYGGNLYTLVIVDDYSRYTWTRFLKNKTEAFEQFEIFSKKIQNQLGCSIVSIRTDHGREFDNEVQFGEFCNANGITHNFSAPRTPQSNGVVERKNRTLQEMSRTMLNEQSLPQKFWCNAVDTSTYILNRILIRAILGKTPYELLRGRKPTLDYFRVFGSKCFILNTKDYLTKFDPKSYECVFLGYSQNSKAYIILNKHTMKIEESLNVTFDETPPPSKTSPLVDDDLDEEKSIKFLEKKKLENNIKDETLEIDEIVNIKESRNHPLENVIGNLNQRTFRSQAQNQSNFFRFISTIEPMNVIETLTDESWLIAMQEELNQFIANDVWELVPQPKNMTIIGTKLVFRNKLDENVVISRNKARSRLSSLLRRLWIVSVILIFGLDQGIGAIDGLDGTERGYQDVCQRLKLYFVYLKKMALEKEVLIMGEPLSLDRVFDFPMDEPEPHPAYDFFAPGPLPGYAGNPNNNNGWIEADVPLLGELGAEADEPMVGPLVDEIAEPIVEMEEQVIALVIDMEEDIAMLFGDGDFSDDDSEGFEDEEEV